MSDVVPRDRWATLDERINAALLKDAEPADIASLIHEAEVATIAAGADSARRDNMSIVFSVAQSRRTCRYNCRSNSR